MTATGQTARENLGQFDLVTPPAPQVWSGDLVIYYQVVAVHAQRLSLYRWARAQMAEFTQC